MLAVQRAHTRSHAITLCSYRRLLSSSSPHCRANLSQLESRKNAILHLSPDELRRHLLFAKKVDQSYGKSPPLVDTASTPKTVQVSDFETVREALKVEAAVLSPSFAEALSSFVDIVQTQILATDTRLRHLDTRLRHLDTRLRHLEAREIRRDIPVSMNVVYANLILKIQAEHEKTAKDKVMGVTEKKTLKTMLGTHVKGYAERDEALKEAQITVIQKNPNARHLAAHVRSSHELADDIIFLEYHIRHSPPSKERDEMQVHADFLATGLAELLGYSYLDAHSKAPVLLKNSAEDLL